MACSPPPRLKFFYYSSDYYYVYIYMSIALKLEGEGLGGCGVVVAQWSEHTQVAQARGPGFNSRQLPGFYPASLLM